ncbi:hypothetical protein BDW59DRAFT_166800 [Aspergillus cavernicola]|uniref:Uncharacterized protein n=1 Tax=Aspergillus cavernicola TaxID=176166 RepID=A0ABR4HIV2_9EURO
MRVIAIFATILALAYATPSLEMEMENRQQNGDCIVLPYTIKSLTLITAVPALSSVTVKA